jgi:hypothetical protein
MFMVVPNTLLEEVLYLFTQINIDKLSPEEKNELRNMRVKMIQYWDNKYFNFLETPNINEFIEPLNIQVKYLTKIVNSQKAN